ncbi:hypothetical protein LCGC14_0835130, partial [marine sediment metagenome]
FYSGQLFSLLGSSITQFVIVWWITIQTGSTIMLAIATFAYIMPMAAVMPIAGVDADKYNRKTIIVIVDSLQAFTTLFIILLFSLELVGPILIIVLNGLLGLCQGFHLPTVSSIIPTMVPKDKLSRINGVSFLFSGFIHTIGPIIAATLLAILPIKIILWIDPLTFIIAIIPLIFIKIPKVISEETQNKKKSFITDLKEGYQTLRLIPIVFMMLLVSMFINFLSRPFQTLMPYYIIFVHSGTPSDLALISAFMSGGILIGAIITSIKKEWKHKIFIYFSLESALLLPTVVFIFLPKGSFLLMGITGAVYGMIMPILNTIYLTLMQTKVPADKLGRVSSMDWAISMGISPVGALLAGFLADIIGVNMLILSSAIVAVIISSIIWRYTSVRYNLDQEQIEKIA